MKTLTRKQSKDFQKQIDEAKRQISAITQSRALTPATVGQVAGASTTKPLNAAQIGGAAGLGFEDEKTQAVISAGDKAASDAGVPRAGAGDGIPSTVNAQRASYILSGAGLTGFIRPEKLVGMSTAEAQKFVTEQKVKQQSQVSPTTSAVFNPEVSGKTKRAIDQLGFALNDITNSPFNGKTSKLNKTKGLIESTSKELAKLFKTPEEFNQAYNTNQTFKDAIDRFQKAGGKADTITSSIVPPADVPQPGVQSTATYLSSINNPLANQEAQTKAINELIPEREADQAEIMRQAGITEDLKKIYFGDEQTTGILQQRQAEEKEAIRISEQEEKNENNSLKAKAQFIIERTNAEVRLQSAKIEENRLAAKNYMTGYLAKLGALNTTGAAGLAIQTLDTQYEMERNELETNAKYANQEIELNLVTDINNVETETDKEILKIQQDLTKTTEEVFKEVNKAQQASDREIYNITAGYKKTLRERTAKFTQDITDAAEKYAKEFAKKAAAYAVPGFTAAGSPSSKNRIVSTIEQTLEAARGADGNVNSPTYIKAYQDWIKAGGTVKTFKNAFPTADYVNPKDYSLPPNLRYAKESQTTPKEKEEDDTDFNTAVPEA